MEQKLDATQERLKADLPHMQKNLVDLEMKLGYLKKEMANLERIIENQRGMIMQAERLLSPEAEMVFGQAEPAQPPPVLAPMNGKVEGEMARPIGADRGEG
jgi:hypothetical protein